MTPIDAQQIADTGILSPETIQQTLAEGLSCKFTGQKVLILVPDHTRSLPLPFLFRTLVELLSDARRITFMVALGTHPSLSEDALETLMGITPEERQTKFSYVKILNHAWNDSEF